MKIRKKSPNEKGGFYGYSFTPKSGNIELREEAILNCVAYGLTEEKAVIGVSH